MDLSVCCRFSVPFVNFVASFLRSDTFVNLRELPMRTCRYLHLDVFTDSPFEGNQLAVFPEPAGLSTEEMQTITREMNFSECTFIFPPDLPHVTAGTPQPAGAEPIDVRMRIFTPGEE